MIERRKVSRNRVFYGGAIAFNDLRSTVDCTIRNFSARGAKVEVPFGTVLSNHVGLTIWHRGEIFPARVTWRRGNETGLAFEMRRDGGNVIDLQRSAACAAACCAASLPTALPACVRGSS